MWQHAQTPNLRELGVCYPRKFLNLQLLLVASETTIIHKQEVIAHHYYGNRYIRQVSPPPSLSLSIIL